MKIKDAPTFETGEVLDPNKLNEKLSEVGKQLEHVQSKRYGHFQVSFPFQRDAQNGYDENTSENLRTYQFYAEESCSIERAYLRFYGDGGAADTVINVDLLNSSDEYIVASGVWLSVTPGTSTTSVEDFDGRRIQLDKDSTYKFRMQSEGTFNSLNTWLDVHFRTDRCTTSGVDYLVEYDQTNFRASDFRDADDIITESGLIKAAVDNLADYTDNPKCELVVFNTVSGVDSSLQTTVSESSGETRTVRRIASYLDLESADTLAWSVSTAVAGFTGNPPGFGSTLEIFFNADQAGSNDRPEDLGLQALGEMTFTGTEPTYNSTGGPAGGGAWDYDRTGRHNYSGGTDTIATAEFSVWTVCKLENDSVGGNSHSTYFSTGQNFGRAVSDGAALNVDGYIEFGNVNGSNVLAQVNSDLTTDNNWYLVVHNWSDSGDDAVYVARLGDTSFTWSDTGTESTGILREDVELGGHGGLNTFDGKLAMVGFHNAIVDETLVLDYVNAYFGRKQTLSVTSASSDNDQLSTDDTGGDVTITVSQTSGSPGVDVRIYSYIWYT